MVNLFLRNTIGISFIIILLLAFRPLLERHFRPQMLYAAWLIVIITSLVPLGGTLQPLWTISSPELRTPIIVETPREVSGERLLVATPSASKQPLPTNPVTGALIEQPTAIPVASTYAGEKQSQIRFQWPDTFTLGVLLWIFGMLIATIIHSVRHVRFFRRVRRWSTSPNGAQQRILCEEARRLGFSHPPPLHRCACATSPMIVGLFHPTMLMPEIELSEEELRLIMRHELMHLKRHDLWGKSLMLLSLIVHWFNPLVYVMARAMASDCEMSCDASVLANADLSTRKYYGEAILGVIQRQCRQQVALSTYFYEGKKSMKKRFTSMLDLTGKRRGALILTSVLILSILAGNVFAVANQASVTTLESANKQEDGIPNSGAKPTDWDKHETPAWFGISAIQHPQNYTASYTPLITVYNRDLTRAETLRLYDLYYYYDRDGRRADVPVQVASDGYTGDIFAISASITDFAALIPLDKRDENLFGTPELWAGVEAAGWMPFLLFPQSEMNDQELLQLIEAVDAFNLLVPYVDPWLVGDEYPNRDMTRQERIRYEEIVDLCERDESYRPKNALNDIPGDGLYIKGYNGGGEMVFHYPENREMTDEELLQMAYELVKRVQSRLAERYYDINAIQEMIGNGDVEAQAVHRLLANMGDANVILDGEPVYDAGTGTWDVSFIENRPAGAPKYHYSF